MKKLLIIIAAITLYSCTKDVQPPAPPVITCDIIFDKVYRNPPADTTLVNRHYFLLITRDTTPGIHPAGTNYEIEVARSTYDSAIFATGIIYTFNCR